MRSEALEHISEDALSGKTTRGHFIKRLGGFLAIGLGIAAVEAATASATTWTCCHSTDQNCINFCQGQSKVAYTCTTSGCPDWCNCQPSGMPDCFSTSSGPC